MNSAGTPNQAGPHRVKRSVRGLTMTTAVAAGVLALGAAGLAPPATAASGALAGTWTSVDLDGSNQTLRVTGAGDPVYSTFYRDDVTSGVCGGPPATLVGHAVSDGDGMTVVGTLVCSGGGNPIPTEHVSFRYEYDGAGDTLTDDSGVVWHRAG